MKESKNNSYKMTPILVMLAVFMFFGASNNLWADSDSDGESACQSYFETLSAGGPTPFGAFNGGALVTIGGVAPEQALATSVLLGSASFDPSAIGQIAFTRAGELFFGPDQFGGIHALTARLRAVGTPTSPTTFDITAKVRFTGGVGRFENAHGRARLNGVATINPQTGDTQLNATLSGKICGVGS